MSKKLEDKTLKDFLFKDQIDPHDVRSLSLSVLSSTGELRYVRHYDSSELDLARMLRVYPDGSFEDQLCVTTDLERFHISTGLHAKYLKKPTKLAY